MYISLAFRAISIKTMGFGRTCFFTVDHSVNNYSFLPLGYANAISALAVPMSSVHESSVHIFYQAMQVF